MVGKSLNYLVLVFLFLAILPLSYSANNLKLNVEPIMTSVYKNSSTLYNLILTNEFSYPIDVSLSFPDLNWVGYTDPLADYRFTLLSKEMKSVKIKYYPSLQIPEGPYSVRLAVKDNTNNKLHSLDLPAYLRPYSMDFQNFLPSLRFSINSPYEIDPREDYKVNLKVENLNFKNIHNLKVRLSYLSDNETQIIDLEGKKSKNLEFSFSLDDYTKPNSDFLKLYAELNDEKNNESYTWKDNRLVKVIAYNKIQKTRNETESFLKSNVEIEVYNDGNIGKKVNIEEKISSFKNLFTTPSLNPSIVERTDGKYYMWDLFLGPNKKEMISYETNYRPIFILFLLIVFSFVLYYVLRSPIIVKKDVVNLATREGGISNIKIIIHIKNRKNTPYESLRIIEKLPRIVNIEENFDIGSIEPVTINRSAKTGTIVKWEFSHIEGYEERIITYKIESKLSILGGLSLPPTLIKFQDKKGRPIKVKSNRINLEI